MKNKNNMVRFDEHFINILLKEGVAHEAIISERQRQETAKFSER